MVNMNLEEKSRSAYRIYYVVNRKRILAQQKAYRDANIEAVRARKRAYYNRNKNKSNIPINQVNQIDDMQVLVNILLKTTKKMTADWAALKKKADELVDWISKCGN